MSVMKEVQTNQPERIEPRELSQRERTIVQMFRRLDEQGREDIIRFLDALLVAR
ncbi:hypothetical protein D3C76_1737640 [compost metagenome]